MNATNDFFIRTSDPEHAAVVTEVVEPAEGERPRLRGHLRGLVLPALRRLQDRRRVDRGQQCPIHLIELEREKEDNWFFRLSAFQEPLEQLYADNPDCVLPKNRYNEALSFIKGGLQRPLAQPRSRICWGVPVPWDQEQVIYVWIDALLNYYSALSLRDARART